MIARLGAWLGLASLALVAAHAPCVAADEKGSLPTIEAEFKAAIKKVTPATVLCTGKSASKGPRLGNGSSGVLMSKRGLVLSDADATAVVRIVGTGRDQKVERSDSDEVEVRVPDLKSGTFKAYTAKVVRKVREADTCLLRIVDPPPAGFKDWLSVGSSDDLAVGDFAFAMGNSFGLSDEALPSLTAGVIAALSPFARGHAEGRWEFLYTTAAVNPGVNGGPLVDIEGRLIGTVSTFMLPEPKNPFQFLGKVIPVQRLRALYGDLPEAAEMFPEAKPVKARSAQAAALEATFAHAARVAAPHVASLVVERSAPYVVLAPIGPNAQVPLARYQGPVSAIVVSAEGELVTSLYNLTNVFSLANPPEPGDTLPAPLRLETGLSSIKRITACFADGRKLVAKVAGVDPRLGIALLTVEGFQDGGYAAPTLVPVPAERFQEGRFVVAVGNPYGEQPAEAPLLSVGLLSKTHALNATSAWRGDWQTDAGVTDANCGGAAVDLEGRVYGMLRIWAPLTHGRSSGIGFVLPWASIQQALPSLRAGRTWRRGMIGISWKRNLDAPTIEEVTPGSPGADAGLKPDDRLKAVDGEPVDTIADARRLLRFRWEGEALKLTVERPGPKKPQEVTVTVTLGGRPEPDAPPAPTPAPAPEPEPAPVPVPVPRPKDP
jgi:S1-C subfamily serine protease